MRCFIIFSILLMFGCGSETLDSNDFPTSSNSAALSPQELLKQFTHTDLVCEKSMINPGKDKCSALVYSNRQPCAQANSACGQQDICIRGKQCLWTYVPSHTVASYGEVQLGYGYKGSPEINALNQAWDQAWRSMAGFKKACEDNIRNKISPSARNIRITLRAPSNRQSGCYAGGCSGINSAKGITSNGDWQQFIRYSYQKISKSWGKDDHKYWLFGSCLAEATWEEPVYYNDIAKCGCAETTRINLTCVDRFASCPAAWNIFPRSITVKELNDELVAQNTGRVGTSNAALSTFCATCDTDAFSSENLIEKLNCLDQSALSLKNNNIVNNQLNTKLKEMQQLAIEFFGNENSAPSYQKYFTPNIQMCGLQFDSSTANLPACALTETLKQCVRLTDEHVNSNVVASLFKTCMDHLETLPKATPTCTLTTEQTDRFLLLLRATSQALLTKLALPLSQKTDDEAVLNKAIDTYLIALNEWHDFIEKITKPAEQTAFKEAVLSEFGAQLSLNAQKNKKITLSTMGETLNVARQVLERLYVKDKALLRDDMLAAVTGKLLLQITERLDGLSVFHDFAKSIAKNKRTDSIDNAGILWQLLAEIGDSEPHLIEVPTSDNFMALLRKLAVHPSMKVLVHTIDAAAQEQNVVNAMSSLPASHLDLALMLAKARDRRTHYLATGKFLDQTLPLIKNTLLESRRYEIARNFTEEVNDFEQRFDVLQMQSNQLIEALYNSTNQEKARITLSNQVNVLNAEIADLLIKRANVAEAMQLSNKDNALKIQNFLLQLKASQNNNIQNYFKIAQQQTNVSARDARFVNKEQMINEIKVLGPFRVPQGGILQVETSGTWSPTCLLRKSAESYRVTIDSYSPVGPEGYTLMRSGSNYSAKSASQSKGEQSTFGVKNHSDAGFSIFGFGGGVTTYSEKTSYTGSQEVSTTGNEMRNTSSFSAGIFSDQAPFRNAPIGSLVLLRYSGNAELALLDQREDTYVVNSSGTTIAAPDSSTFYLAVNDTVCGDADATGQLAVKVTAMQPYSDLFDPAKLAGAKIAEAISIGLKTIHEQKDKIVARGEMLPSERAFLQTFAHWSSVRSNDQAQALNEHPDLVQLYELLIFQELETIERALQIAKFDEVLKIKLLEWSSLQKQLQLEAEAKNLQQVLVERAARNVASDYMQVRVNEIIQNYNQMIESAIDLWCPEVAVKLADREDITTILTQGIHWTFDEVALSTRRLLSDLVREYNTCTAATSLGREDALVLIGIPHPDRKDQFQPVLSELPEEQANGFWQAFAAKQSFEIALSPEILHGNARELACNATLPVIHYAALLLAMPNNVSAQDLNAIPIRYTATQQHEQNLATPAGFVRVHFSDEERLSWPVPIIFTNYQSEIYSMVEQTFTQHSMKMKQQEVGTSLYGNFSINLSTNFTYPDFRNNEFVGAYLVVAVETSNQPGRMSWIPGCE